MRVNIGPHTLILGDANEILPELPGRDLCLTDPPYGIGLSRGLNFTGSRSSVAQQREYDGNWDDERLDATTLQLILNSAKNTILFGGNYYADLLPQAKHWFVWDKDNFMPSRSDCELVWTNLPLTSVKKVKYQAIGCMGRRMEKREHPTQKPVDVMGWCLMRVPKALTVIDPFMGSGTTGVACVRYGRQFIGIEQDRKYFDIAVRRMEEALDQPDMLTMTEAVQAEQGGLFDGDR